MSTTIGIVAVSPEGSALCYRQIGRLASDVEDESKRPSVALHNLPFSTYLQAIRNNDWPLVGRMLRDSAERLTQAGADFLILPDNIAHFAFHLAHSDSTAPWLNMIELVAEAVKKDGRSTVGLIGTKPVMHGSVYQSVLGLAGVKLVVPDDQDAEAIDRIIFTELVKGQAEDASRRRVDEAISRLADRGCEGLILGSTETPLIVSASRCALPAYDPVALLVDGAMRRAMSDAAA